MKKLITICLFMATIFKVNAQNNTTDLIEKLNSKIQITSRKGIGTMANHPAYTANIYFDDEGAHYKYSDKRGGWYLYKWDEFAGLAVTTQNRVYLAANETNGQTTFEYITPKSGIKAEEIKNLLDEIIYQKTDKSVRIFTMQIKDENDVPDAASYSSAATSSSTDYQNNSQEMQAAEAMGAMLEGLTFFNWEFVGRSTFNPAPTTSKETTYGIDEFRFNLILGKNHFRFNISPVGFSWLSLPDFKKYNDQGIKIGTVTNYSVKSYTPSAGLSYVLYPKADKGEEYRFVEFPLSVHFSPFLGFKNDNFKENDITDSEYKEYFSDFNYFVYSSFGISLFFSRDFGMSLKAGAFYLNVKESEKVLKHTDEDGISENFIVKFDEKSKILPAGELSFTLRF